MKKLIFIFALILSACADEPVKEKEGGASDCIDPNRWGKIDACYLIYKPVCGCNNVTYGNDCEAMMAGVTSWTEGSCPK